MASQPSTPKYLYPGHAAARLIVDDGRAAFVDVGTNYSVPRICLAALDELGIARNARSTTCCSPHVHLDHAGGAGTLLRELPQAVALLHPRGAPHMIEPSKLIAGAKAVVRRASLRAASTASSFPSPPPGCARSRTGSACP